MGRYDSNTRALATGGRGCEHFLAVASEAGVELTKGDRAAVKHAKSRRGNVASGWLALS